MDGVDDLVDLGSVLLRGVRVVQRVDHQTRAVDVENPSPHPKAHHLTGRRCVFGYTARTFHPSASHLSPTETISPAIVAYRDIAPAIVAGEKFLWGVVLGRGSAKELAPCPKWALRRCIGVGAIGAGARYLLQSVAGAGTGSSWRIQSGRFNDVVGWAGDGTERQPSRPLPTSLPDVTSTDARRPWRPNRPHPDTTQPRCAAHTATQRRWWLQMQLPSLGGAQRSDGIALAAIADVRARAETWWLEAAECKNTPIEWWFPTGGRAGPASKRPASCVPAVRFRRSVSTT